MAQEAPTRGDPAHALRCSEAPPSSESACTKGLERSAGGARFSPSRLVCDSKIQVGEHPPATNDRQTDAQRGPPALQLGERKHLKLPACCGQRLERTCSRDERRTRCRAWPFRPPPWCRTVSVLRPVRPSPQPAAPCPCHLDAPDGKASERTVASTAPRAPVTSHRHPVHVLPPLIRPDQLTPHAMFCLLRALLCPRDPTSPELPPCSSEKPSRSQDPLVWPWCPGSIPPHIQAPPPTQGPASVTTPLGCQW